jgi:putative oxidoreductase
LWQSGWGKLHNLDKVTEFFASLNMPAPAQMAVPVYAHVARLG